jgi:PPM family protein phosphatase
VDISEEETMPIRGAAKSEVGKVRLKNEDTFGFFPGTSFYVVADGMGGHAGGEIASQLAVETMHASLQETKDEDLTPILDAEGRSSLAGRRLLIAAERANGQVFDASRERPELSGMGTTIAAVLFEERGRQAGICHVGDSRVYRVRERQIAQLTEDHSLVQQLLRDGKITPQEAKNSPHKHVLVQALGIGPEVHPAVRVEATNPGDVFILCSDGVHGVVEAGEMLDLVTQTPGDLRTVCDSLLNLANTRGGPDNSTVIVLQYE